MAQHLLRIIHLKYETMIVMEQYFRSESDSCSTKFSCGPMHELCMRKHSISYCYRIVRIYGFWWFFSIPIFAFAIAIALLSDVLVSFIAFTFFLLFTRAPCNINAWRLWFSLGNRMNISPERKESEILLHFRACSPEWHLKASSIKDIKDIFCRRWVIHMRRY